MLHATYTPGANDILTGGVSLTLTGFGMADQSTCDPSVSVMELSIVEEVVPEFEQIGPLCQYSEPPDLPAISMNGISGTWNPPVINTSIIGEQIFVFTPDSGTCAIPTTQE